MKITPAQYIKYCNQLVKLIEEEHISPKTIDCVVGIARGGLALAQQVAYYFNIKQVQSIGISSYRQKRQIGIKCYQPISIVKGHWPDILVVDDLADSGNTLKFVKDHLLEVSPECKITIATLFMKTDTIVIPDIFCTTVDKKVWITFPYDKEE